MADNPRSTSPARQDPHLKDRGDYTEQDIQNIRGKGGILPDITLDEAEETYLFARVAQALSKTLTRQGLTVGLEAKAAARDLLGDAVRFMQFPRFRDSEGVVHERSQTTKRYYPGRSFSLSLTATF